MKVKKILMMGNDIQTYIDLIERELIKNEISYVKISEEDYYEIHFLNYIYKIYHTYESTKTLPYLLQEITNHLYENTFLNYELNNKDFNPTIIENRRAFEEERNKRRIFENKCNKVKVNTKGFKNNFRRR